MDIKFLLLLLLLLPIETPSGNIVTNCVMSDTRYIDRHEVYITNRKTSMKLACVLASGRIEILCENSYTKSKLARMPVAALSDK